MRLHQRKARRGLLSTRSRLTSCGRRLRVVTSDAHSPSSTFLASPPLSLPTESAAHPAELGAGCMGGHRQQDPQHRQSKLLAARAWMGRGSSSRPRRILRPICWSLPRPSSSLHGACTSFGSCVLNHRTFSGVPLQRIGAPATHGGAAHSPPRTAKPSAARSAGLQRPAAQRVPPGVILRRAPHPVEEATPSHGLPPQRHPGGARRSALPPQPLSPSNLPRGAQISPPPPPPVPRFPSGALRLGDLVRRRNLPTTNRGQNKRR